MASIVKRALVLAGLVAAIGGGTAATASAASAVPVSGPDSAFVAIEEDTREFTGTGVANTRAEAERKGFDLAVSRAATAGYGGCVYVDSLAERLGSGWRVRVTVLCTRIG